MEKNTLGTCTYISYVYDIVPTVQGLCERRGSREGEQRVPSKSIVYLFPWWQGWGDTAVVGGGRVATLGTVLVRSGMLCCSFIIG